MSNPLEKKPRSHFDRLRNSILPIIVRTVFKINHSEIFQVGFETKNISWLKIIVCETNGTIDSREKLSKKNSFDFEEKCRRFYFRFLNSSEKLQTD